MRSEDSCEGQWTAVFESQLQTWPVPNSLFFDHSSENKFDIKIRSTHHLIDLIKQGKLPDKIMLNVHPQRWNDEFVPWVRELVWQNVKNVVKRQINKFRNSRI